MAGLRNSLLASAAIVMVLPTSGAWAQDQETEAQDENVIVVTARKQAETLQDVPISVAVAQGETLRSNVVTTLEDFTQNTPTVTVARTPVSDAIYIRGVGSGTSVGFQQSVGTFVDGVYRGRGPAARAAFLDIERVEVLRGPQPVYFGNSTVGGAFNIVSRGPSDTLEINAQSSYEFNADEWVTEVGVGGPLNDIVGVRLAYNHTESDGWLTDTVQGGRVPVVNNDAMRGTIAITPDSSFDATLKVEYSDNEETGGYLQVVECNASVPPAIFGPACNPSIFTVPGFEDELDFRLARGGTFPNGQTQVDSNSLQLLNISLGMNYEFGDGHTLSSVTGLVDYDNRRQIDVDSGPGPFAFGQADRTEDFQQWSQEIRLTSPQDQALIYLLGVYYEDGELDYLQRSSNGTAGPPGNPLFNGVLSQGTFVQDQTTLALFGSVAYEITDNLTISVGARWTDVDTEAFKQQRTLTLDGEPGSPALIAAAAAPGPNPRDEHDLPGSRTDRDFTPAFEIQYEPIPEITLYASYKEAFKTGGFDPNIQLAVLALPTPLDPNGGFEFDDEQAEAFEIGAKMSLFDDTLLLNIAAFNTDFSNLQVAAFDSATNSFVTGNAAGARTRGIELDATWRATDFLTFTTAMTLLDGEYTEFETAQCNRIQQAAFVPMGPGDQCVTSIDGQTLPFAPDFSGNVGYNLDLPITDTLNLISTGAMNFTSEFTGVQNADPTEIQDGFVKFDARVGVSGNDGQWELALYGRNLTDEVTFRFRAELPGPSGRFALVDRRRELGIQVRFNY